MRSTCWLLLAILSLAACTQVQNEQRLNRKLAGIVSPPCETASDPTCAFNNSPVQLVGTPKRLPKRALDFFETAERLEFLDANRRRWIAPEKTLTDGASIPKIFISMIGNPRSAEFLNAGAIHDAYCGIGNEHLNTYHAGRWQEVHRMFYDALRIGGTPAPKAKIMFAAVYLGGPRWGVHNRALGKVSTAAMQAALASAIGFIESESPSLADLESYLIAKESGLTSTAARGASPGASNQTPDVTVGPTTTDDPTTTTDPTTAVGLTQI